MAFRDRLPTFGRTQPPPFGNPGPEQTLGHTPRPPDPGTVPPRVGAPPIGGSGRANFSGLPQWDELNQKLTGQRGLAIFDDMYWTDAHIRRLVLAAWAPLVAGTWTLEPYGGEEASQQDKDIADAIWWMLSEWMSPNFTEHLAEVGPALLRFGFVPFEEQWDDVVYKGKTLMGPRKLGFMLPRTIWKWWQDDYGELTHIGQILPNRGEVVVAASELVYYRLAAEGDNWMGRSLLRHAYKHWYLKDKLEILDAIGQERKAVGVPVVYVSPDTPKETRDEIQTAVANMHVSEVAYLQLPGWKMGEAPPDAGQANQFLVDIVQFDSSSGEGIKGSIDYHQQAIAASFLEDFLELGHHQVGARATADVQEDPFLAAINGALLPPVIPPLNRLVDRIRKLNWKGADGSPQLKLTLHDEASLSEISAYIQQLVMAQAMQVDDDLEDWARERAGLPPANQEARAQNQKLKQAQQEAQLAGAQASAQDPQGLQKAQALAAAKVPPDGDSEPPNPDKPSQGTPASAGKSQPGSAKPPAPKDAVAAARAKKKLSREEARQIYLDALQAENDWKLAQIDHEMDELTELDAPTDPPNLRDATDPAECCQTCKMFWHGECGGYWNKPVRVDQVCDSWAQSETGTVQLDGFAPMSGGTSGENGLQMVPDIPGVCSCDAPHYHNGKCTNCGGSKPANPKQPATAGKQLDNATAEPTAKWFERLLSQDRLRDAFDGARDHIQASVGPDALRAARLMAHQAAIGADVAAIQPPPELADALTRHYTDMYALGHATVQDELAKQRRALGKQLDTPADIAEGAAASRLGRARQRGEHSARNIASRVSEVLGRATITGLKDPAALQTAAEQATTGQLRMEALANTAAMINDGRADSAMSASDIAGAYYTSVLDPSTCDACEKADDGTLLTPEQAILLGPPNPDCAGADRCRCALVWVLSSDPAALASVVGDSGGG